MSETMGDKITAGSVRQIAMRGCAVNEGVVAAQRLVAGCADPTEIARKVKLAFKKMPGEMALTCFAVAMTSTLPRSVKVAVWDAVRYSHIWWGVDDVLKGAALENPIVQKAFADAVPMRKWVVERQVEGYQGVCMTLDSDVAFTQTFAQTELRTG